MKVNIKTFNNPLFGEIRVFEIDDTPHFVGRDIAIALGYSDPVSAILQHVDNEDKAKHPIPDNQGLIQQTIIINESGVYSLVFGSKLESAKQFKKWVTSEVLPAIRKHGGYLTQQKIEEVLANPDTIIQLATQLKEERRKSQALEACNRENLQQLKLQAPKVQYYDEVLDGQGLISTTIIAKDLGMSANALNNKLHKMGVIYQVQGAWVPYSRYQDTGYCKSKTFPYVDKDGKQKTVIHFYWTEKGRQFIINLLQNFKRA